MQNVISIVLCPNIWHILENIPWDSRDLWPLVTSIQKILEGVFRSKEKVKHAENVQDQVSSSGTLNQSNRAPEKQ